MIRELTWSSSNPSVANVNANGKVTALSVGSSVLTARVNETGQEFNCNVRVIAPIEPSMIVTANGIDIPMMKVDGGTFTMGATPEQGDDAYDSEKPVHQVTLSDYYIGQTEVTQKLWEAVMGSNPSYFKGTKKPVERVSWNDIVNEFLPRLNALTGKNFTLPTEAQWEFAARGGNKSKGYKYSGSNTIDDVAWNRGNHYPLKTHPVGQKLPNELGIYDMSGNVEEWCSDRYGDYNGESQTHPLGSSSGLRRVLRGGCFSNEPSFCRISYRGFDYPDNECENKYRGFRLALSDIIALNKKSILLVERQSEKLIVGLNGIVPLKNGLIWFSSNPSVAKVDANGQVTAINEGTAIITARVNEAKLDLNCKVEVKTPVKPAMVVIVNQISIPLMKVEGGIFTMGPTPEQGDDVYDDDKLTHQVTLSDYYIGQTEVTQELWEAVMGSNPSKYKNPKNPVECVTWNDIVNDFLPKLNELTGKKFTIPTEAQWEFAAKGGNKSKGYKYSGSNNIDDVAWYGERRNTRTTHPVGQKLPNELGIYDMSGNVYEWCSDWYEAYSAEAQTDPIGPESSSSRVLRGGCFDGYARNCRVSRRLHYYPDYKSYDCGFRLVLDLQFYSNFYP